MIDKLTMSIATRYFQSYHGLKGEQMIADVIVDLQYGDCGKGKVTHHLLKDGGYTHCIRYNGGCNAGHTIYHHGTKFVTHHLPAGCFLASSLLLGLAVLSTLISSLESLISWILKALLPKDSSLLQKMRTLSPTSIWKKTEKTKK